MVGEYDRSEILFCVVDSSKHILRHLWLLVFCVPHSIRAYDHNLQVAEGDARFFSLLDRSGDSLLTNIFEGLKKARQIFRSNRLSLKFEGPKILLNSK